jgi:hypothetical protein
LRCGLPPKAGLAFLNSPRPAYVGGLQERCVHLESRRSSTIRKRCLASDASQANGQEASETPMMKTPKSKYTPIRARLSTLACLIALCGTLGFAHRLAAAPVAPRDPPFSSERVAQLPLAVRREVSSRCKSDPQAGHYFATYDDRSSVLRLDYSLLQCDGSPPLCRQSACSQETFVKRHGRFVLQRAEK